jgi:hypothetical protein
MAGAATRTPQVSTNAVIWRFVTAGSYAYTVPDSFLRCRSLVIVWHGCHARF